MSYYEIQNLYKSKDIMEFKKVYAMEKIHGSSAHITWKNRQLSFFPGGSPYPIFVKIFDQEKLRQILDEKFGERKVVVYGEAYGGCFNYKTPILLSDGKKLPIGQIVNNRLNVKVLSYNIENGRLEENKILDWFKYPALDNEWMTFWVEKRLRGGKGTRIITTKSHIIYTKKDNEITEIEAKNLKTGDIVFLPGNKLTYFQEQLIRGSVLGDGHISKDKFKCTHSKKQQEYIDFKIKLLNNIISSSEERISGFGSKVICIITKSFSEIRRIRKELYQNNKKIINSDYLNKLNSIALAFWYMDDGSLVKHPNDKHRDTCKLHTYGYSEEEVDLIVSFLNSRGFFCNKRKLKKYFGIHFTPEGTIAFHSEISPYIIPSMRYKLINEFRDCPINMFWEFLVKSQNSKNDSYGLIESVVTKVKECSPYKKGVYLTTKYDLCIKNNNNYFANNVLVHNSMQSMSDVYGPDLKFVCFEVTIDENWLSVPKAERVVLDLGLEFVDYRLVETTIEALDAERDRPSVQAVRNGMGENHQREGIVLRPPFELRYNNGDRIIAKHKAEKFRETKNPRRLDSEKLEVLAKAEEIADEWVTSRRMEHVLDQFPDATMENLGDIIKAMISDIEKEAGGEVENFKEARKAIGKKTAELFKSEMKYEFVREISSNKD